MLFKVSTKQLIKINNHAFSAWSQRSRLESLDTVSHRKQFPIGTEHGHNDPPRRVWTQRSTLSICFYNHQRKLTFGFWKWSQRSWLESLDTSSHSKQSPIGTVHGHNDPPRRVWTQRSSLSMLQNSNRNLKQHVLNVTGYSASKRNTPLYLSLLLTL